MTNKKAQLMDKPFIFIFTLVVAAFVFIFGFYVINNLIKTSSCAQLGIFYTDLNEQVNRYYNFDVGSSTEVQLKLPKKIKYFCVFSKEESLDKTELDKISAGLYDVFTSVDENIALIPINYCQKSLFYIGKLRPKENPLCILNTGKVKFILENKGTFVEASK
jgi:hypothetical protein